MAIYRFEAKIIGRSDRAGGRSVVACAAYRSASKIYCEKYDYTPDYRRRSAGVEYEVIRSPDGAPQWAKERASLWNEVEAKEDTHNKKATARLSRELLLSLPAELDTPEQRKALLVGFADQELVSRGMIADIAIHTPSPNGDDRNFHAHVLTTMREITPEGFGNKRMDWDKKELLLDLRKAWETHVNAALEAAGSDARVDCRSLKEQGVDREPQPKIGVAATAMERKGVATDKGEQAMETQMENLTRPLRRAIEAGDAMPTWGIGKDWWVQAKAVLRNTWDSVKETARELWRDESSGTPIPSFAPEASPSYWQDKLREERQERNAPEPGRG